MIELESEVNNIDETVSNLEQRVNELENEKAERSRVESIEARVRELEPVTIDLTNRERQILEVFFENSGQFLDIDRISTESGLSRSNAGSHMSNLKDKIEFDVQTMEKNKKKYRLPKQEKNKILGNR